MFFYIPLIISLFALLFSVFLIKRIQIIPVSFGKTIAISNYLKEKGSVYLKKQLRTVFVIVPLLFLILWSFLGFKIASGFLLGVAFSAISGLAGMITPLRVSLKVAEAAKGGLAPAFNLAFRGGELLGFLVAGLGLLSVNVFFILTKDPMALVALAFGASLLSFFVRLDKGISAGMATDFLGTYVAVMAATTFLGDLSFPGNQAALLLPSFLAGATILASIIAGFFIKFPSNKNIAPILFKYLGMSALISALGFLLIIRNFAPSLDFSFWQIYLPAFMGLVLAVSLALVRQYASLPIILICLGTSVSFWLFGPMGLSMVALSIISLAGIIAALDSYRSIAGSASGIAKISSLPDEIKEIAASLNVEVNNAKAFIKNYSIVSASLAALVLFSVFNLKMGHLGIRVPFHLDDYRALIGFFSGGLLLFIFPARKTRTIAKALMPLIFPILVGFILGPLALVWFLIGSLAVGIFMAIFTVSGPVIASTIKVINILALLIASLLA